MARKRFIGPITYHNTGHFGSRTAYSIKAVEGHYLSFGPQTKGVKTIMLGLQGMLRMAMNAQFRRKNLFRFEPDIVQALSRAEPVFKRV